MLVDVPGEQTPPRPKGTRSNGKSKNYLPSLNGGRGIAALMVFGGHFLALQFATPAGSAAKYDAGSTGGLGGTDAFMFEVFNGLMPVPVNYFFVLSGFVLAWIYRPGQSATGFWVKRLAKVYPVYFVTTCVAFLLWGLLANKWTEWNIVLSHIFLLQAWTPDQNTLMGLNIVMWTLSNEVFLYLLFPALMMMLTQFSTRALQFVGVLCVVASFVIPPWVGNLVNLREPVAVTSPLEGFENPFTYWFTLMFPPMRLLQFVLGMTVALLMLRGIKWFVPNLPVAFVIFAAGLWITNAWLPVEARYVAGMLIPIALLIASMANADQAGKWTPLRTRPLLFVGKIGYSLYAVHILFILFTIVHIPGPTGATDYPRLWLYEMGLLADPTAAVPGWANFTLFFVYMAVTLFAAWVLHRFVEEPVSGLIRNRVNRKRVPSVAVEQPPVAEPVGRT